MSVTEFSRFFQGTARDCLLRALDLALDEDGRDLTSLGLFAPHDLLEARIVAKEPCVVAGLPLIGLVLERCAAAYHPGAAWDYRLEHEEGVEVPPGTVLARMSGQAALLLKAERVILNFICHMSGIAGLTRRYARALSGSRTRLLDTRKTLPGLRYPEKYAVLVGGGCNHRLNLEEMLMLKDNHIDRAGSISGAVAALRTTYNPCPPIEVECRTLDEVREAAACGVQRIMLDNMGPDAIRLALPLIPRGIESEISGGVSLERLPELGALGADFISVGRITHSAPVADLSMQVQPLQCAAATASAEGAPVADVHGLRKALGDSLVIMAHHYQHDQVVRHADHIGDSLELSRLVPGLDARYIVFCGVYFMAESAAILAKEGQEVFIPAPDADCVMSRMAPPQLVEEVLTRLNSGARKVIPIAYVNTSAAVKALCGRFDGTVCTSANAATILKWGLERGDAVLFLPDKNLALNTANTLQLPESERLVLDVRGNGARVTPDLATSHRLLVWPGCCAIHHRFTTAQIAAKRQASPGALVVVHPECPPKVVQASDSVGSTSHIIRYTAQAPAGSVIYIGTELNLVERLAQRHAPEKTILPLAPIACSNMAKVTEAKLAAVLDGLSKGRPPLLPVRVPPEVAAPARLALERMLEASS